MISPERILNLNDRTASKNSEFVIYWMQQAQRAHYNHALEHAVFVANELRLPLVVYFGLTDNFPGANLRHYAFMVEGLFETRKALEKRGIRMIVRHESPEKGIVAFAKKAAGVICDRGYTRIQKAWREHAAKALPCPLVQVESDVVVPVEVASFKEEYSAFTLRKKISKHLVEYLVPLKSVRLKYKSLDLSFPGKELSGDPESILKQLKIDSSVPPSPVFKGGTAAARKLLRQFIKTRLSKYDTGRNDPTLDFQSELSPYLHFGQISPLFVALEVAKADGAGVDAFLEELIVRRELAMNFAFYNPYYDSFDCLPDWAQKTLFKHRKDHRQYVYDLETFEKGKTHDPYWNSAQLQMVYTGKMHGYMRMYWGKKLIEWTKDPKEAYRIAVYLNDKYELDGRDPNGYAGVAWCFGKHDRPWGEREIFGTVRYMNDKGLLRKFDAKGYVQKIENMKGKYQ